MLSKAVSVGCAFVVYSSTASMCQVQYLSVDEDWKAIEESILTLLSLLNQPSSISVCSLSYIVGFSVKPLNVPAFLQRAECLRVKK